MGDKTGIQWTDATWNPIRGCSRVSEGFRNCYAETVANRFKGPGQPYEGLIARGGQWNGQITVADHLLDQPLRWSRPRRIFVNSMSDLFHENVPFDLIHRIMLQMAFANHHTYQVLTKRPARMLEFFEWWGTEAKRCFAAEMPHVWLGVSIEDQATADQRIPQLLQTPAAVRWISAEPLLGPVDLSAMRNSTGLGEGQPWLCPLIGSVGDGHGDTCSVDRIDWVVVGGESGPGARPMHPEWARTLRDQCQAAGTPFFFKQWGEWKPFCEGGGWHDSLYRSNRKAKEGESQSTFDDIYGRTCTVPHGVLQLNGDVMEIIDLGAWGEGAMSVYKVGKHSAGRLLDGREWNEYPMVTA